MGNRQENALKEKTKPKLEIFPISWFMAKKKEEIFLVTSLMSNETRSKKEFLQKILSGDFGLGTVFFPILQVTFHADLLAGLKHDFPEDRTMNAVGPTLVVGNSRFTL